MVAAGCVGLAQACLDAAVRYAGEGVAVVIATSRIQAQLVQSWDVLATMTPAEYSAFRNHLGKASGFQSFQYRMLEFIIGNKNADTIVVHKRDERTYAALEAALQAADAKTGRTAVEPAP